MTIYVDELPVSPSPVTRPDTLPEDLDIFFGATGLRKFRDQLNALPAIMAAIAASAPLSAIFTFHTATAGDPGSGGFRLDNATQGSATGAGLDLEDVNGVDVSGILARMGLGSSTVKGDLLVSKVDDPRIWLVAEVTAGASPGGYRALTLQNTAASLAGAFAEGDEVRVSYVRTGDQGPIGVAGGTPHAIFEEQRASNIGSSTPHVGGAHNSVALNTEVQDSLGIFALNGTDIDFLQAGVFYVAAWVQAIGTNAVQANLYNVTDATVIKPGLSGAAMDIGSSYFTSGFSYVAAEFTIAAPKTIRLRQWAGQAGGTYAAGQPSGSGLAEVYAHMAITKK